MIKPKQPPCIALVMRSNAPPAKCWCKQNQDLDQNGNVVRSPHVRLHLLQFFFFFSPGTCQVSRGKNTKNCCIPSFKRPPNTGGNIGAGLQALNVKGSQHNDKSCLSHVKGPSIVLPLFTERTKCHGRPLKAAKLWPEVCTEHSPI